MWDNVEGVAGFPPGTPSAWNTKEQAELRDFLADLRSTHAKILLTSRHREHSWLGRLPARIALTAMPMRESVELAAATAARHGRRVDDVDDWRPLLAYAAGNPSPSPSPSPKRSAKTSTPEPISKASSSASEPAKATTTTRPKAAPDPWAPRCATGTPPPSAPPNNPDWPHLAVFQGFADIDALVAMGHPDLPGHLSALAGITRDTWTALADRAADAGLLSSLGGGYYRHHPALPWFLTPTLTHTDGPPETPGHQGVLHAYTAALAALADHYQQRLHPR